MKCSAETKESYQAAKELFDALKSDGDVLDCGKRKASKAGYIYLSVLSFILIILNL